MIEGGVVVSVWNFREYYVLECWDLDRQDKLIHFYMIKRSHDVQFGDYVWWDGSILFLRPADTEVESKLERI